MTDARFRKPEWRRLLSAGSVLVLGLLFTFPTTTYGQGQLLGALHGTVKDQQGGVLPGVVITATPTESRPPQSAIADAAGFYTLKGLPPGEYQIKAELPGFATLVQSGVVARAGLTISLDLAMSIGGVGEIVTVRRESPLLEASSAATAMNIGGDFQRALPTSQRRNWSDALALAPGVVTAETTTGGLTNNYYVHGSSFSSHVFQIDGADLGSATIGQPFYIALSTDLIADVHIKTAGVDASAPLGTGAIMTLATKSGTNALSGALTTTYQPKKWNDHNVPGGTSPKVRLLQPDISLGGPIMKDRLWFFGAYRRIEAATGVARSPGQIALLSQLEPSFEAFDLANTANLYFLKITAHPTLHHRVSGFYQSDFNRTEAAGPQNASPTVNEIGGRAVSGRVTSTWNDSLTSELGVSYNNKTFQAPQFETDGPYQEVFRNVVLSSGRLVGADLVGTIGAPSFRWTSQPARKLTLTYDVTHFRPRLAGTHEFKAGVFLQPHIHNESVRHYIRDGEAMERLVLRDPANPGAGATPFQRSAWPESVQQYRSDGSDLALYLQDLWRAGRATITMGVRIDRVKYTDKIFDITTQSSVDVGPRVGLNYAIRKDGRAVARVTWSRVHDRVAGAAFAGTVSATESRAFDLNLDGVFETVDSIPGSSALSRNRVFDEELHQPYVNELTAGYRHQLAGQVTLDVGIVRRQMRDRFAMVDINGVFDRGLFQGYLDESQNEIYRATNNIWNWPVYTAFELSATKQTSRLQLIASYTRQWRHLDGTWQPNDPAFFVQPDAFSNDRGLGPTSGSSLSFPAEANSLSGFGMVVDAFVSSPWRDHLARAGVSLHAPWGVTISANYTYQSGPWSGPVVRRLSAPDPAFGPPLLTLTNGRSVPNPLATIVRFAHDTRSAGQFELDDFHALNLRLAKDIRVGRTRLTLMTDLYNLTNNDADQGLVFEGNVLGSSNFGVEANRQVPRGAQIGARVSF